MVTKKRDTQATYAFFKRLHKNLENQESLLQIWDTLRLFGIYVNQNINGDPYIKEVKNSTH